MPENLKEYLVKRGIQAVRVISALFFDAIITLAWLGIAAAVYWACNLARDHGIDEWAIQTFRWVSTLGTLALTVNFVARDVISELRRPLSEPDTDVPNVGEEA